MGFVQQSLEGGQVTDDHFPHARIVFSKRSGETVIRCQAKGARFGTFVVRFGRFKKDRFMMCHLCQQIETLERAILGFVPNQLRHIVVVARHSIRERLGGILMEKRVQNSDFFPERALDAQYFHVDLKAPELKGPTDWRPLMARVAESDRPYGQLPLRYHLWMATEIRSEGSSLGSRIAPV